MTFHMQELEVLKSVSDWSHAEGGHWTERSEGSGCSDSGSRNEHECAKFQAMAESATDREAGGNCIIKDNRSKQ